MDDAFSEKLNAILSNPEAMKTIAALAGQMAGPGAPEGAAFSDEKAARTEKAGPEKDPFSDLLQSDLYAGAARLFSGKEAAARIALLAALKPYLEENRRDKLDGILRVMRALEWLGKLQSRR